MKYCLLIISLLSFSFLEAQVVLSSSSFYQIGDSLPVAIDRIPELTDYRAQSGGNWDFRILQAPYKSYIVLKAPDAGQASDQFPQAEMVAILPGGQEEYYDIDQGKLLLLGTYGADPLDMGITLPLIYDSALPILQEGMKSGDQFQLSTTAAVTFPADQLPSTTLRQLPVIPDSLRIVLSIHQNVVVAESGNLRLLNNTYEVLNVQKETKKDFKLEVKTGRLSWQDISALYSDQEKLHPPVVQSFHFYTEEKHGSLVDIYLDPEWSPSIDYIQFDAWEQNIPAKTFESTTPSVLVYPNPAIVDAIFEFANFPIANYTLAIYNLIGVEVWSQPLLLNGDKTIKFNVSRLNKGTYWYNIKDEYGKILYTNRLFVVKP
jgi:hypothetical protein